MREFPYHKDRCLPFVYYMCILCCRLTHFRGGSIEYRALLYIMLNEFRAYTRICPLSHTVTQLTVIRDRMAL